MSDGLRKGIHALIDVATEEELRRVLGMFAETPDPEGIAPLTGPEAGNGSTVRAGAQNGS
jgi:hypothetical protein